MSTKKTTGDKWIRLLRSYTPVADNEAMQAEHVDNLAASLGVPKISFVHPAKEDLIRCFPMNTGEFTNTVLTGTAGDGKTSLCIELIRELTGQSKIAPGGIAKIDVDTDQGQRGVTVIYDVTAWRKKTGGTLHSDQIKVLEEMAESVYGQSDKYFVLAVNDGQMHELFRALPSDASAKLRNLERDLIGQHAQQTSNLPARLKLFNLSQISSEKIMRLCLGALLNRDEWSCFENEASNPLFGEKSSIRKNFQVMRSPEMQNKLIMLAKVADMAEHHLPVRGVLCMLTNAILGHPDAKDGVLRPDAESAEIFNKCDPSRAAFHRTLFGENLTQSVRKKRGIYRFLFMLHIGEETTNDLDELFIFGSRDAELSENYQSLVLPDPYSQRNTSFDEMVGRYIKGDLISEESNRQFLNELTAERRRVFIHTDDASIKKYNLWRTTVFHHAGEYLEEIVEPLKNRKEPPRSTLRKVATGLNRVWTGLLLSEEVNEVYFATGLDLTASPVSDIFLAQIDLDSEPPACQIVSHPVNPVPHVLFRLNGKEISFKLSLIRFEFLCRVADGAMPSSFSKEASSDLMALKQRILRDLDLKVGNRTLNLIEVNESGAIRKRPIHLGG